MENISSNAELQGAIQLLEAEQAVKLKLMKDQFHLAYENLKPSKIIVSALKDIATTPYLINNILVTASGLVTGFYSQKAITGKSDNKLRKLFGYMIQYGITNLIAQNPKAIKSLGQFVSHHIFHKEK